VYESPDDAKEAMNKLNGFHLMERYIVGESRLPPGSSVRATQLGSCADLVVLYHHPSKQQASALAKAEIRAREQAVALEKQRLGLRDDQ
jgi:pre-mRNA branch site protein p14